METPHSISEDLRKAEFTGGKTPMAHEAVCECNQPSRCDKC